MALSSEELKAQLSAVRFEPTRTISIMADRLEAAFNGENLLVDPSNPLVFLLESQVILTAAAVDEDYLLNNNSYPVMAVTEENLNNNLSDKEYEGQFGTPATAWFEIWLSEDEIRTNAVPVGTTGTKKLTIPRHTKITVQGMAFTFQYPINYIVKKHNSIDVVYDGSQPSPIQPLDGNAVDWGTYEVKDLENNQGVIRMIRVRTELKQMKNTSYTYSLSGAKQLKKAVKFDDNYYYTRAFRRPKNGDWVEIKTTHSQQVFDIMDPTLLLEVVGNTLVVELPYVYFATGLATGDIRVDVYTTKGPIEMDLTNINNGSYVAEYEDLDRSDNLLYSAPMSALSTVTINAAAITGGTSRPTFAERRQRMLNNSVGDPDTPISPSQMVNALTEAGFDSKMVVDLVTKRTYLASKAMPTNLEGRSGSGIDCAVLTAKYSIDELLKLDTVIDNGERCTLTPATLFQNIDGVLQIVSDEDRRTFERLRDDTFVAAINDGNYLYTPLHYVLDSSNHEFSVRPYYLTSPAFDVTSYKASNDTLGLTVSASTTRTIIKDDQGYLVQVKSSSNPAWKALGDDQVHVQLAFQPVGEDRFAYINGTQVAVSGERVFQFRIGTSWDLTPQHELVTTNFSMFEPLARKFLSPLENDFHLIWSVSDYTTPGAGTSDVDKVLGGFLLPEGTIGIYHEAIRIKMGDSLGTDEGLTRQGTRRRNYGLWARARGMVGDAKYVTYPENVYATWDRNVYEEEIVDGKRTPVFETDANGNRSLKVKFAKGSFILNGDGEKTIIKHKGEAMVDPITGEYVLQSGRYVMRWWDMCLFDAVYRYASYGPDKAYSDAVPKVLATWVNTILAGIAGRTLEETNILFQPRNTLKFIECLVDDSELKTLNTAQRLTITFFVTKDVYTDNDVRSAMETSAKAQVLLGLDSSVVARDLLVDAIRSNVGVDAVGIRLTGLGGEDNDYDVVTLLDESARLCLAKAIEQQADGKYAVIDGLEINFKLHAEQS